MSNRNKISIFSNPDSDESVCSLSANVSSFSTNTSLTSSEVDGDYPTTVVANSTTTTTTNNNHQTTTQQHHTLSAQISNLAIQTDGSAAYYCLDSSSSESTTGRSSSKHSNQLPLRRSTRLKSTSSRPNTPDINTTRCKTPSAAELAAKAKDIADLLHTLEGSSSSNEATAATAATTATTSSSSSHPKTSEAQRGGSIASSSASSSTSATNNSSAVAATEKDLTPLGDNLRLFNQRYETKDAVNTTPLKNSNRKPARVAALLSRLSIDEVATAAAGEPIVAESSSDDSDDGAERSSPSPRKLRVRTPSTKCLESFQLTPPRRSLTPPRRSTRRSASSKKYSEHMGELQRKKEKRSQRRSKDNEDKSNEDVDDDGEEDVSMMECDEETRKKSSMLYDQMAGDVAGQQMFSFRTPKKRDGMALLAASAPKTPQTPRTPKHLRKMRDAPKTPKTPKSNGPQQPMMLTKTPSRFRTRMKKELSKIAVDPETSGTDFSADESDEYQPTETAAADDADSYSSSSDHAITSASSDDDQNRRPIAKYVPPTIKTTAAAAAATATATGRVTRSSARRQCDFVLESDGYFSHHTNKKTITSDRTLDRLKTPRLPHDHLFRLLAATTLSGAHETAIAEMNRDYQSHFSKWLFILNEGYNLLLHGLGSKRMLLQQFHESVLAEQTVLVVNGFFPSLTIKDILDHISVDILEMATVTRNLHECVDAIEAELQRNRELHIFLIVHNVDGTMLRNHKAQLILSRLAKCEQIHLIASMDHINAPLLWDHTKLSNYNFSWWDVTTLLPYSEETAFENSMLVHNSGGLALSSMKNVFLSLTDNSRGIFLIVVKNQIANKGNANFQGMPFKDLYSRCREDFLVSSDVALRSQLTEFIDHNLVKMRRTADGTEHLTIPLEHGLLQQFLEEQENP